jgi:hypothetical protein
MVHKELTCQILDQLRKIFQEQGKNLGGYNQDIYSGFRASLHVGEGTNQQKYTSVLGARGT